MRSVFISICLLLGVTTSDLWAKTVVLPTRLLTSTTVFSDRQQTEIGVAELIHFIASQNKQVVLTSGVEIERLYNRFGAGFFRKLTKTKLNSVCNSYRASYLIISDMSVYASSIRLNGLVYNCYNSSIQYKVNNEAKGLNPYPAITKFTAGLFRFARPLVKPSTPSWGRQKILILDTSSPMVGDVPQLLMHIRESYRDFIQSNQLGFLVLNPNRKLLLRPTNSVNKINGFLGQVPLGGKFPKAAPFYEGLRKIEQVVEHPVDVTIFLNRAPATKKARLQIENRVRLFQSQGSTVSLVTFRGTNRNEERWFSRLSAIGGGSLKPIVYRQRVVTQDGRYFYLDLAGSNFNLVDSFLDANVIRNSIALDDTARIFLPDITSHIESTTRFRFMKLYPFTNDLGKVIAGTFQGTRGAAPAYDKFLVRPQTGAGQPWWLECAPAVCAQLASTQNRGYYFGVRFQRRFASATGISNDPNEVLVWTRNNPPPRLLIRNMSQILADREAYTRPAAGLFWFIYGNIVQQNQSRDMDIQAQ